MTELHAGDVVLDQDGQPHVVVLVSDISVGVRRLYPTFLGPVKDLNLFKSWVTDEDPPGWWARRLEEEL